MKIGLYDLDSKIANLALMKIAAFHRSQGDQVEAYLPLDTFDKVYVSKIFNYSKMPEYPIDNMEIGGTGFDIKKRLPSEIDECEPDYSIYPKATYSVIFFSRGCIRDCGFCVVQEKEGRIHAVKPNNLNPNGQWIEVLDNNFFANPEWKLSIEYLIKNNQPCNFHGIDVRIITEEQASYLKQLKFGGGNRSTWSKNDGFVTKSLKIAWDKYSDKEKVLSGIKNMLKHISSHKIMCYVLIGFKSTQEEDLERVMTLREMKIDPFVMPFDKSDPYQKKFARWVNMKAIFKTVKWKDYK